MKLFIRTAVAIALIATLGACGPSKPLPPTDARAAKIAACLYPSSPPESGAPLSSAAPVPVPGKSLTHIRIYLYAIHWDDGKGECDIHFAAVFATHLYATADGAATFVAPNGGTLPYDVNRSTPATVDLYLTHARPVTIDLTYQAKHQPISTAPFDSYVTVGCVVRDDRGIRAADARPQTSDGAFVSCAPKWIAE